MKPIGKDAAPWGKSKDLDEMVLDSLISLSESILTQILVGFWFFGFFALLGFELRTLLSRC
jgi:hypothetical protein